MVIVGKVCFVQVLFALLTAAISDDKQQHHHHRRHRHHHHGSAQNSSTLAQSSASNSSGSLLAQELLSRRSEQAAAGHDSAAVPMQQVAAPKRHARMVAAPQASQTVNAAVVQASDEQILQKMKHLEKELDEKERAVKISFAKGHLNVNGPLPIDFSDRFAQGVADATGCHAAEVELLGAVPVPEAQGKVEEIMFRSRSDVVAVVEDQAANPQSKLANGILHSFLVAPDEADEPEESSETDQKDSKSEHEAEPEPEQTAAAAAPVVPEVDMSMPYGDLEPFGREDTAQELTESSIRESNAMVDQLEKAEVAEEKRAVFRALSRLRGAAITSYDGIARSQTGNIDDYARDNQWRKAHPVHHLADDEADVSKWAFPDDVEE